MLRGSNRREEGKQQKKKDLTAHFDSSTGNKFRPLVVGNIEPQSALR